MRPGDGHRSRIWAPVLRAVEVRVGGEVVSLQPGTWVESAVFMGSPGHRPPRSAFGATSPDSLMLRRIGRIPDATELVIVPGATTVAALASIAPADPPAHRLPARAEPRTPTSAAHGRIVCTTPAELATPAAHPLSDMPILVLADEMVDVPPGAVLEMLACMEAIGADVVVPLSNIGQPLCLPVGRSEPRSVARPMPGGRSPRAIADALRRLPAQHVATVADRVAAAVFSPAGAARWHAGEPLVAVTCLNAYAWAPPTLERGVQLDARPLPAGVSATAVAELAREVIAEGRPAGLPIVFVCDGVGPVGGTQVILNLCDALNDMGISASITHKFTGSYPHAFVSKSAPLALAKGEMIAALPDRLGWERGAPGVVVATSWGTGDTVRAICERHDGIVPVAFWQDREDLFERHDGKPAGSGEFGNYLAIRHRIAVSEWVLASAEAERLIGSPGPSDLRVVTPPALDRAFTRLPAPTREPSDGRPVRILAMWRPMTAARRGMPRIAALYEALAAAYKGKRAGRVSLEVFGWSDGVPAGVRSHGHLTTEQVAALMREVDIVVEPSEFQGFGLPGLEAIACGAALVTTPCRGPDEYVTSGSTPNAVVADDHDSLLPAVRRLIDDPAALAEIQRNAAATPIATWPERAAQFASAVRLALNLTTVGV